MCGLVGLYARNTTSDNHLKLLRGLLFVDAVRGEDATGLAKIDLAKNKADIFKRAVPAHQFLGDEELIDFMIKDRGRVWIGHNRWATIGDKTDDNNAHPFQADHITLAHNGTVNRWTLKDLEGYSDPACNVDSEMVARTIAKYGAHEAITKKLSGAFALVWYDANERTLNFIRNKERPLYLAVLRDNTLVWASEERFLDFFVERPKSPYAYDKDGKPTELKEDTLVSFQFNEHGTLMNNGKAKVVPMKFFQSANPNPPVVYNSGRRRQGYCDDNEYAEWFGMGGNSTPSSTNLNSYEDRVTDTLKKNGFPHKSYGSTISFEPRTFKSNGGASRFGELRGTFGVTHEVVVYSAERSWFEDHKWIDAEITNVSEVWDKGMKHLLLTVRNLKPSNTGKPRVTLTVAVDNSQKKSNAVVAEVEAEAKTNPADPRYPVSDSRSKWIIGTFPLKVDGHTFQSGQEFSNFVIRKCIMCNCIPTKENIYNPWIYVAKGHDVAHLTDAEFVCGRCSLIDDQQQADIDKILEKHE